MLLGERQRSMRRGQHARARRRVSRPRAAVVAQHHLLDRLPGTEGLWVKAVGQRKLRRGDRLIAPVDHRIGEAAVGRGVGARQAAADEIGDPGAQSI